MVDLVFPPGSDGRIPVVAVTGTNGKTTTARLIAHLFSAQGLRVGMTNTDGVYVNGRHLIQGGQPVEVFEQALRQIAAEV